MIYRAVDARAAEAALADFEAGPWGQKYPAIGQSWRRVWQEVIPFFSFPGEVRRIIYTTNAIEALNSKLRRAIRARGHFPSDEAAAKLLYLIAYSDEAGHAFRFHSGHPFRNEAGHRSDLKPATCASFG